MLNGIFIYVRVILRAYKARFIMKAFNGKRIKLYLNANYGALTVTGKFIDSEDDFIVVENELTRKIQ